MACACPPSNLIGEEEGKGFIQLMSQLPYERLLLCVSAAAAIELAVELTVEYTKQRKAFGQTLADFQNTRFKLAECATDAHVVRTFLNDCTQRLLDGTLDDAGRLHGQVVVHRAAGQGHRRMPAALRWLRLHGRVPDRAALRRRARAAHLWRHDRDHEGPDRAKARDKRGGIP